MSNNLYNKNLNSILEVEKAARNEIEKAYIDKKNLINDTREKLEIEIENFRIEENKKKELEMKEIELKNSQDQGRIQIHNTELSKIKEDYLKNKQKTIDFLVTTILNVDMTVPDVVIGKFAKKVMG